MKNRIVLIGTYMGNIIKGNLIFALILLMALSLASANPETVATSPRNASFGGRIPQEEWNRTFGGSSDDVGTFGQQTKDGGYIIIGYTSSYGADTPYSWLINPPHRGDLWLIKTDSNGEKEWDRTFGGLGKDLGFSVQQTNDGGYIITGGKKSFWIGNYHVWLIKTDSNGIMEWDRTFEGTGEDLGFSVQQTRDGGYVIAGYTSFSDGRKVWLIKTDQEGNKEWDVSLGRANSEAASARQTKDDGFIITGYTSSGENKEDVFLIKTDPKGNWEWFKTFGGPNKDIGFSVQETKDSGYIITGVTSLGAGKENVWLIKTDSKGNKDWDKTFGGTGYNAGTCVQQTWDDGYIITGYNSTSTSIKRSYFQLLPSTYLGRVWLIKTDSKGDREWDMTFGGLGNDWGNFVQETQDGGYIIIGVAESYGAGKEDVWLIKIK
jgi:hypothetical protein